MTDAELLELNAWWRGYLTAGKATFTVPSIAHPSRHRTYEIHTKVDDRDPARRVHFVRAKMTDEDTQPTWEYVGLYTPEEGHVRLTRKSAFNDRSDVYQTVEYVATALGQGLPVEITPVGQCSVCSRPLEDPTSVLLGIGPVCRQGMGFDVQRLTRFLGQDTPRQEPRQRKGR